MIDERHLMTIFSGALDREAGANRVAYLDEICGSDAELRTRIDALLRAHEHAAQFLEPQTASAPDAATNPQAGTQLVGCYKLLELVGEGGMGSVWMAQQTEPVKRLVALKLIKAGMDSKQVIARFEAERQALALMDHPNIAKVLDGGTTPSGRPYFVMDLVKGVPITKYCDEHHLTPRQRLELLIPVCQAVQHAHQKGIIHRDLKPSNVLVALYDGRPVPKIIDFGVAKAAGPQLTEKTLITGFGNIVGTLEYMSPEQAEINQLDIDTRSDIYSLGVLLYELLAGSPPFSRKELEKAGMLEMLRVIREQEPPVPSNKLSTAEGLPTLAANRSTEPAKLTKLLRGELDWIVMKALEKDRNRRYETANGFAMDLQRYLADEPVQACPPSAAYRLRKFARRNKGPVLAASLVVLALIVGMIGATWGLLRAEHARQGEEEQRLAAEAAADRATTAQDRAERGFAKAKEAVEQYLTAVTDDPDLKHKHDLHDLRKKLLDAAVPFYQWFSEQKPGEPPLEAERGRAYRRLGLVRSEMGEADAARKDYERAQAIFAQLVVDVPTVPAYRQELALIHDNLGHVLADMGQLQAAEQAYRRALDLEEKLAADLPTVPAYRQELASIQRNMASVLLDLGQWPAAEQAYGRVLEVQERLAAEFPNEPGYRQDLALSHQAHGAVLANLGQRPTAEQAYRRALDIQEKLAAEFPTVPAYRDNLATSHHNLGQLLKDVGQHPAAEQAYRRALDIREKLAADFPTVPVYRRYLARCHNSLAILLHDGGAAVQAYRRALDIQEKLAADFPTVPDYRYDLGMSHSNLGGVLSRLEQRPAAEEAYRQALNIQEKLAADFPTVPSYRRELARYHHNLGLLLAAQGLAEASSALFARAVTLLEPLVQQEPRLLNQRTLLRDVYWAWANGLHKLGRHAESVEAWDRALALNSVEDQEPFFRRCRAIALARAGEHAKAFAEANALAEAKGVTAGTLYEVACVCALSSAKVKDAKNSDADARQLAERYAGRAIELLRQAVAEGYKNAAHVRENNDLDILRDREDFKSLVAELEAKNQ